jgi:hypothetical protein
MVDDGGCNDGSLDSETSYSLVEISMRLLIFYL